MGASWMSAPPEPVAAEATYRGTVTGASPPRHRPRAGGPAEPGHEGRHLLGRFAAELLAAQSLELPVLAHRVSPVALGQVGGDQAAPGALAQRVGGHGRLADLDGLGEPAAADE